MKKPMRYVFVLANSIIFFFGTFIGAVDRYEVKAPKTAMIGDSNLVVELIPQLKSQVDLSRHSVKTMGLPSGASLVRKESALGLTLEGPAIYNLVLNPATPAGPFLLRFQKSNSAKAQGAAFVLVEKTVARLVLTPLGMTPPRLGEPVPFQVMAVDDDGAVVTSYRDPVDLSADVGEVSEAIIAGEKFEKGVARVAVVFNATDPATSLNRLTARAHLLYGGQQEKAFGTIDLSLRSAGERR